MLNREEIKKLIVGKKVIRNFCNLDIQLTPNGFDLTLAELFKFDSAGVLDFSNSERVIPEGKAIIPEKENPDDEYGWWKLGKGVYKVRPNEVFYLPNNLIAISFPRSSLLRMGAYTHTAFWDAGFEGKVEFLLSVGNDAGIKLKQNARIAQVTFIPINETAEGYNGIFKNIQ